MLSEKTKSRLKAIAAIFAVFAVIGALKYVPIYRPLLGETPPWQEAGALIKEGKCAQGVALYERLGREGDRLAYRNLAEIYMWGDCGVRDLSRTVAYLRQAAANGDCESSADLAKLAINFPEIDGVEHISPRNNFLAYGLCSGESDSALRKEYFYDFLDSAVPEAFFKAMSDRKKLMEGPVSKWDAITRQISEGQGFDQNPIPREQFETKQE